MKFDDFIKKANTKERDHALILPANGSTDSKNSKSKEDKLKSKKKAGQ